MRKKEIMVGSKEEVNKETEEQRRKERRKEILSSDLFLLKKLSISCIFDPFRETTFNLSASYESTYSATHSWEKLFSTCPVIT
jgi:hypothetical protein